MGNNKTSIAKQKQTLLFSMVGNAGFFIVFTLIGPLPFIPMEPNVHLIRVHKQKIF
jgi:hypothetical protein